MGFPQPSANDYALSGQDTFRLNTLLSSAGDLYESEQSGHAFALGPDSDISKVNVAYFDSQAEPSFMQQLAISPRRAWSGRIDAQNKQGLYMPSKVPGRILLWPDELYNADYLPTGFDPVTQTIQWIVPVLDVIQYFKPQSALQPSRNDKSYQIQNFLNTVAETHIMVPYYGRRYFMIEATNFTAADFTIRVFGLNFAITDSQVTNTNQDKALAFQIIGAGAPPEPTIIIGNASAVGHNINVPDTATFTGRFDYLRVVVVGPTVGAQQTPIRITVSDME